MNERNVRFHLLVGMSLAVIVSISAAEESGQEPRKQALDTRSVLVSWTNDADKVSDEQPEFAVRDSEEGEAESEELKAAVDQGYQLMARGKLQEAIDVFKTALEYDPLSKRGRFGLGTVYIRMGFYREALDILEAMEKEFPDDYSLKNNIGWLYATSKDPAIRDSAKAIRYAQEALLLAPRDYHVWSTLSEGYYIAGEFEKALRAAEEALALCSDAPHGVSIEEYRRQVSKSRKAAQAMSILE